MISQHSVDPSVEAVHPQNPPGLSINMTDFSGIDKNIDTTMHKSVSLPLIPTRELQALEFEVSMVDPDEYPTWFVVLSPREEKGVSGPHNVAQLRKMRSDGEITETSLAWQDGLKDWSQIRYLPFLKHKILQPPRIPPKKEGETSDPLPPIATVEQVRKVEELQDFNLMQFCSKCGGHAAYHTPGIGEQLVPNFPRLEEGSPVPVASEVVSGFLWIANAGGGKKGPIRQLGATLIINCTENLMTPQSSPPMFRCIQLPLKEYIAGQTADSDFDIEAILEVFQTVYEYLEFEKLYPERWADLDKMVPKYQGPMDREGKPIRRLGLQAPHVKLASTTARPRSADKSSRSMSMRRPPSPSLSLRGSRPTSPSSPHMLSSPGSPGSPSNPAEEAEIEKQRKRHVRNIHALRRSLFTRKAQLELNKGPVEHPEKNKYGNAPIKRPPDRPSRVMIFSRLGVDRSAAIAAAYMIKLYGISVETALSIIRKNRKTLKISPPYMKALKKWESMHILGEKLCGDCILAGGRNAAQGGGGGSGSMLGDAVITSLAQLEPKVSPSPARQQEHIALDAALSSLQDHHHAVAGHVSDNETLSDHSISTGAAGRRNIPPSDMYLHMAPCVVDLPPGICVSPVSIGAGATLLPNNPSFAALMELNLGGAMLGDEKVCMIFKALASTKILANKATAAGEQCLIRRLRIIDVNSNNLTCVGVGAICEALLGLEVKLPEASLMSSLAPGTLQRTREGDDAGGYTEKEFRMFAQLDWELLSLDFSQNRISERGATNISTLLRYCTSILTLTVTNNEMDDAACAALVTALKRPPEEFPVDQTDDTAKYAAYARPAKKAPAVVSKDSFNQSLTELNIGGNNLSTRGINSLTDALKENAVLYTLRIDFSPAVSPKGFKELFNALRSHNQGLNRLSLSDNSLSVKSFSYALRAYEGDDATLSWLAASRCNLTSRHIASLARFSNTTRSLTHLDLSGNHIGDAGAEWIAKVLWGRFIKRNLEQRNLASDSDEEEDGGNAATASTNGGDNTVSTGAEGSASSFNTTNTKKKVKQKRMILDESDDEEMPADAPNYPPLRYLDLSTCSIDAAGAQAILQAATCRPDLTYLDISDNNLGQNFFTSGKEGAPTEALKALSNCRFVDFKMNRCKLQPRGAVAVFQLLSTPGDSAIGRSLRSLHLSGNGVKDSAADALFELMKGNDTLLTLDLGFNEFTDAVIGDVSKATEVTSSSSLRKRLIPLNINMMGNACDPYALALPGRARAKNVFDVGIHAPERVGASQMRAYDNVESHALGNYLERKDHAGKYLEETPSVRFNTVS